MYIALAQVNPIIGDFSGNLDKILQNISQAKAKGADCVLFSEMVLTGYPPEDLLFKHGFVESCTSALKVILDHSKGIGIIVGLPRRDEKGDLFNSAAIIDDGQLLGFQDKTLLPTYDVFNERRYFTPSEKREVFTVKGKRVAITICEDIWHDFPYPYFPKYETDPIKDYEGKNIDICVNLSASPYHKKKFEMRQSACQATAKRLNCPFFFCNQVGANDSLIFSGLSFGLDTQGNLLGIAKEFDEDLVVIDSESRQTYDFKRDSMESLAQALILGVRDYFYKQGFKKACIGISGGIDSAVVACIATEALGADNVLGVMMPSRFTSKESIDDAEQLIKNLGIKSLTLPIGKPFRSFLDLLEEPFDEVPHDVTEENIQARIRCTLLMALSNKWGHIVLSTGNKSEMALGYATLYGDLTGGLAVISDVVKQDVYALGRYFKKVPENVFVKEPSAELRDNQKDRDSLPPYELIDAVVKMYEEDVLSCEEIAEKLKTPLNEIKEIIDRIHQNEYKRRQSPPGLRVSQKAYTVGRRFPIVQKFLR